MTAITEVQLVPVKFNSGLTFFANFVLDEKFFVGNVAVYSLLNKDGFRLVYPNKRLANGQEISLFYPTSREVEEEIRKVISAEANRLLAVDNDQLAGKYVFGKRRVD